MKAVCFGENWAYLDREPKVKALNLAFFQALI